MDAETLQSCSQALATAATWVDADNVGAVLARWHQPEELLSQLGEAPWFLSQLGKAPVVSPTGHGAFWFWCKRP